MSFLSSDTFIQAIDFAIIGATLVSAWFWWLASRRTVRRISLKETLDAQDMNRLVTALNRTQILNARAALSASIAAVLAATRVLADALTR